MVKTIVQIGNPILLQKSLELSEAELLSRETQKLIDDLIDTCDSEKEGTAGLSAVQIGELKRIFVARRVDLENPEDEDDNPIWEVMVNPKITVIDDSPSEIWEGCLSIGKGGERLFGPVSRPRKIRVEYMDRAGEKHELVAEGYMSHVVLHENDHLDGKLFLSYIQDPANIWKSKDLDDYLDDHDHYPPVR